MKNDNILHRKDANEVDKSINDAMWKLDFNNINIWKAIIDLFKDLWEKISRKFGKKGKKK
jgi:hypothetical protein